MSSDTKAHAFPSVGIFFLSRARTTTLVPRAVHVTASWTLPDPQNPLGWG